MELTIYLKNVCLTQVEVEQRMWYHTEELQTMTTIVHSLENRLITINNDHEAEKQKHIQEVDDLSAPLINVGEIFEISREYVVLLCVLTFFRSSNGSLLRSSKNFRSKFSTSLTKLNKREFYLDFCSYCFVSTFITFLILTELRQMVRRFVSVTQSSSSAVLVIV